MVDITSLRRGGALLIPFCRRPRAFSGFFSGSWTTLRLLGARLGQIPALKSAESGFRMDREELLFAQSGHLGAGAGVWAEFFYFLEKKSIK